jgi:peptidoglycan-associated lipoprotein
MASTPATAPSTSPRPAAPSTAAATVSPPPYVDPKSRLSTERSVYFDFDDNAIKSDYNALIERHGKFLASSPKVTIKIEGNADERGGSEYNLSLGQKRAEAVLRALKIYGVKDGQMEAISWGKTKPKSLGHDEQAWAQNRRADLQYPDK